MAKKVTKKAARRFGFYSAEKVARLDALELASWKEYQADLEAGVYDREYVCDGEDVPANFWD